MTKHKFVQSLRAEPGLYPNTLEEIARWMREGFRVVTHSAMAAKTQDGGQRFYHCFVMEKEECDRETLGQIKDQVAKTAQAIESFTESVTALMASISDKEEGNHGNI